MLWPFDLQVAGKELGRTVEEENLPTRAKMEGILLHAQGDPFPLQEAHYHSGHLLKWG